MLEAVEQRGRASSEWLHFRFWIIVLLLVDRRSRLRVFKPQPRGGRPRGRHFSYSPDQRMHDEQLVHYYGVHQIYWESDLFECSVKEVRQGRQSQPSLKTSQYSNTEVHTKALPRVPQKPLRKPRHVT